MRVTHRLGRLRLRLDATEAALLESLLDELNEVLADSDGVERDADPVTERLFPAAYPADEEAEAEYRSLTEASLRADRRERIGQCAADLAAGPDVDLSDADAARRWIQVLNDLRLALGTRLGVSEDDQDVDRQVAPGHPAAPGWSIYYWLTAVQDSVVTAVMR